MQETNNDPLQSERVFYMLIDHVIIPERLVPFLNRAILIWGKNWYYNNALNRKSAESILNKIKAKIDSNCILILTRLSLVLFGVWFSKRFMNTLVDINVR